MGQIHPAGSRITRSSSPARLCARLWQRFDDNEVLSRHAQRVSIQAQHRQSDRPVEGCPFSISRLEERGAPLDPARSVQNMSIIAFKPLIIVFRPT